MAKKIREMEDYSMFIKTCRFEECRIEYPDWTGEEKYIVYSDSSTQELEELFPEIMQALSPYVVMNKEMRKVIRCSQKNMTKHNDRANDSISLDDRTRDDILLGLYHNPVEESELKLAIDKLAEKQKKRFLLRYLYGLTYTEIAAVENVTRWAVENSIAKAIEKIKIFLN